jgi:uncharacterized protein involved in type VI secretion and phage assembly
VPRDSHRPPGDAEAGDPGADRGRGRRKKEIDLDDPAAVREVPLDRALATRPAVRVRVSEWAGKEWGSSSRRGSAEVIVEFFEGDPIA